MTNAFTYNVNSSTATGFYPISTNLVTIAGSNSNQAHRTYTEVGAPTEMTHHVTTLGPIVGCIDSLSSSTSDKTAEVDDEWHLPKHHTHSMLIPRNGPLPHQLQQPYMAYVRSNEVSCYNTNCHSNVDCSLQSCLSSPNTTTSSPSRNGPKVQFSDTIPSGSPSKITTAVTSV